MIGRANEAVIAIDAIRPLIPDAVILDIRLSRDTGINVLEYVNKPDVHRP
jgi:DNA-binding NarL/FixJ family response regulator